MRRWDNGTRSNSAAIIQKRFFAQARKLFRRSFICPPMSQKNQVAGTCRFVAGCVRGAGAKAADCQKPRPLLHRFILQYGVPPEQYSHFSLTSPLMLSRIWGLVSEK